MFNESLFKKRNLALIFPLLISLILISLGDIAYAQDSNEDNQTQTRSDDYFNYFKVNDNNTNISHNALDEFFNKGYQNDQVDSLKSLENSYQKPNILPFSPEISFNNNIVNVKISISGKSYIYRPSLNLVIDPNLTSYQEPVLPEATAHSDALGDSFVYFEEVKFSIPVQKATAGDIMILHYQGCDESGICYPPQSIVITIPYDINTNQDTKPNDGFKQLDGNIHTNQSTQIQTKVESQTNKESDESSNNSVSYLSSAQNNKEGNSTSGFVSFFSDGKSDNSDAISDLLSENLFIGLIICFLLGIGLDLTPCVLPMLPIFSAMIIGSKKMSVKPVDVLERNDDNNDKDNSLVRRLNFVFMQNLGFALGLALTYTVLGLLFSMAGAQLHSFLQSAALNFVLAILMIICALACADVFELKVPNFITSRLQSGTSKLNTSKFPGAFFLGASAAIIASPCTSAPLAGALLYVMKNGDTLMGSLVFFTIGMGMATPLFIIGMFGSKFLLKSGILGDIIKRLMVVVLIATAYIIVRHNLGRADVFIGALVTYIICVYTLVSIFFFIRRRALPMITATVILVISLVPTYLSLGYFENSIKQHTYEAFYSAQDLNTLNRLSEHNYSFVVFTAQWCANCKIMEKDIYSTDHFINSSMEFRKILVNITDTNDPNIKDIIDKYHVIGVPFFMTLDDEGKVVQSRLGIASTKTVYEALDRLRKLSNNEN